MPEKKATENQLEMRRNMGCAATALGWLIMFVTLVFVVYGLVWIIPVDSSASSEAREPPPMPPMYWEVWFFKLLLALFVGAALYYFGNRLEHPKRWINSDQTEITPEPDARQKLDIPQRARSTGAQFITHWSWQDAFAVLQPIAYLLGIGFLVFLPFIIIFIFAPALSVGNDGILLTNPVVTSAVTLIVTGWGLYYLIKIYRLPQLKCPDCGENLPRLRLLISAYHSGHGRWVCQYCGCELDRQGNRVRSSMIAVSESATSVARGNAWRLRNSAIRIIHTIALVSGLICVSVLVVTILVPNEQSVAAEDVTMWFALSVRAVLPWLLISGALVFVISSYLIRSRKKCPVCGTLAPKYTFLRFSRRSDQRGWTCLICGIQIDRQGNPLSAVQNVSVSLADLQTLTPIERIAAFNQLERRRNWGCLFRVLGGLLLAIMGPIIFLALARELIPFLISLTLIESEMPASPERLPRYVGLVEFFGSASLIRFAFVIYIGTAFFYLGSRISQHAPISLKG